MTIRGVTLLEPPTRRDAQVGAVIITLAAAVSVALFMAGRALTRAAGRAAPSAGDRTPTHR